MEVWKARLTGFAESLMLELLGVGGKQGYLERGVVALERIAAQLEAQNAREEFQLDKQTRKDRG